MKVTKPLIYFDVENKNGRIYRKQEVMPKVKDLLDKNTLTGLTYGELGHPDNFDISLSNVSHGISNVYEKDNILYGEINLLKTKPGKFLQENLDRFVFRPRATGIVDADKNVRIQKLLTFDAVLKEEDSFSDFVKVEPLTLWQKVKFWIYNNLYYKYLKKQENLI